MSFAVPLIAGKDLLSPTSFESAGAGVLCTVLFSGLGGVNVFGYPVAYTVFAFTVPLACKCRSAETGLIAGILAAFGVALAERDPYSAAALVLAAVMCRAFSAGARPLPAAALMLGALDVYPEPLEVEPEYHSTPEAENAQTEIRAEYTDGFLTEEDPDYDE